MKHLIVFAHPKHESFNRAILDTTVGVLKNKGHEVVVRDLYAINFEPVLKTQDTNAMKAGQTPEDIKNEQEFITWADTITLIYPIWWTGMPAILKGYIDRVFAYGFAYSYGKDGSGKLLKGKKGLIINTHGAANEKYDKMGMTAGLKITTDIGIFDYTGIELLEHMFFGNIGSMDEAAHLDILKQVEEKVTALNLN